MGPRHACQASSAVSGMPSLQSAWRLHAPNLHRRAAKTHALRWGEQTVAVELVDGNMGWCDAPCMRLCVCARLRAASARRTATTLGIGEVG